MEKTDYKSILEDKKFDSAEEYVNQIDQILEEGEMLRAIEIAHNLEEMVLDGNVTFKSTDKKEGQSEYDLYLENHAIKALLQDEKLIYKIQDTYKNINKRDPDRSSDGIDTWFKYEDNTNAITICGRAVINCKLIDVISIFNEIDLLKVSVTTFEDIFIIKKESFAKWLAQVTLKMPITITNREAAMLGFALFDKKEKVFIIAFKSVDKSEHELTPDCPKTHCRIEISYGFYILKYLDENRIELFNCFNVDPKVSVPWFIINTFIKNVGYYIVSDFRQTCEDEKKIALYQKRIQEKPDFYAKVKRAIALD